MKKLFTILAAVTLVLLCFILAPTEAKAASVGDLTFELNWDGEGYYVSGCSASASGDMVIPATHNGKPVTSIGVYAFYRCSGLTNITIPDSVDSIGAWAFRLCDNLKGIWVSEDNPNLSSDAQGALYNKEKTTLIKAPCGMEGDFVIPDGVRTIQKDALMWCDKITSLTIPASLTEIMDEAMGDLNSLKEIRVDKNNTAFWSDSYGVLFNKDKTTLFIAPGKITGTYTIPQGVTTINDSAFSGCTGLTGLSIPDSMTRIGSYAFYDCTNLTSIYITDTDFWLQCQIVGGSANPLYYGGKLYVNNEPLTNLVVSDDVTTIRPFTFIHCTTLKSVTLPDGLTTIGLCAFAGCTGLTDINIPDSVTTIGQEAFSGCTSLRVITLPDTVTDLGESVFYGCINLESVNVPKGITGIKGLTFYQCESLKSITIPDNITYIDYRAFERCYSLTDITISDGVTGVGNGAFAECTGLVSVTLPDSITSLGSNVFYRCENLKSIDLPDGLTVIGDSAFKQCYKLTSITIPNGVTTIESWAFTHGNSLTNVNIPSSVTNIGSYAFGYCYELINVTYCGTEEQWNQISVEGGNKWLTGTKRSYHNFADNICTVCGAKDYPVDPNLQFTAAPGLSFQDYIGMQIMFQNAKAKDYDKYYVEITQITPEGPVTTISAGMPFPGFETSFTLFEQQIVSWSMTEKVTMTLYAEKNGVIYQGASFTASVMDLAREKIPQYYKTGDMARCRIFVDMLNYGAAVQVAFDHNAANLPNAKLGDLAKYGTQTQPEMTAENVISGSGTAKVVANNISLQDKVEFNFMIKDTTLATYTPKATLNGAEVAYQVTSVGSGYSVVRVAIGAANMRSTYTFALYNANGTIASAVYNVSAEAYAREKLTGTTGAAYVAMMQYGDAVAVIA